MRVFVAGASGAVGSRLLPLLVSAGHAVVGLTRSQAKTDAIRRGGGEAAEADAFNRAAIVQAVVVAKPDVIVHEMTSLSGANDLRRFDRSFSVTNRLRTEGLQNLLAAAKQAGTPRIVAQSFCGWPYARIGGPVKSEEDPLDPRAAAGAAANARGDPLSRERRDGFARYRGRRPCDTARSTVPGPAS
jgi:nucleoside-diphosphate-sugar epimerase